VPALEHAPCRDRRVEIREDARRFTPPWPRRISWITPAIRAIPPTFRFVGRTTPTPEACPRNGCQAPGKTGAYIDAVRLFPWRTLPVLGLLAGLALGACTGQFESLAPAAIPASTELTSAAIPGSAALTSAAPTVAPTAPAVARDDSALDQDVDARLHAQPTLSGRWKRLSETTSYLAAKDAVAPDGGVDVIVHFHGTKLAEEAWRTTAIGALVVGVQLPGHGVGPYRETFAAPERFRAMVDAAVSRVGGTHVRRLGLVSWSAGYGAVEDVLSDPGLYAMVDTVVLLDSMHVSYKEGLPDETSLATFERFARDAVRGDKQLIVTHSSIVPGEYASTTETASMLLASAGATRAFERKKNQHGMIEFYHADEGGFHVRGFRGEYWRDHLEQVQLAGDEVRAFIAPRWTRLAIQDDRERKSTGSSKGNPVSIASTVAPGAA
jgi:hypothetical protein